MKKKRNITPIAILGIFVTTSLIGFYIYKSFIISGLNLVTSHMPPSTSRDTKDWKTYTSEKFGFSIDYPTVWNVQTSEHGVTFSSLSPDKFSGKQIFIDATNLNGVTLPAKVWLDDKYKEYLNCKDQECYGTVDYHFVKETTLGAGKYPSTKSAFQTQGDLSTFRIEYYVPHSSKLFTIQLNGNTDEEAKMSDSDNFDEQNTETGKIYTQILSTFKFTR